MRPDWTDLFANLPQAWQKFEKARGNYDLTLEEILCQPTDPQPRRRIDWLRSVLKRRGTCRVLELGAGNGWAARVLTEDGHEVVASDVLDDPQIGLGCAVRQRAATGRWFGCVLTCAEVLPFVSESFDCVVCHATLGYVVDRERVLREVARVLRPGGIFAALHEQFRGLLTTPTQRLQGNPEGDFGLGQGSLRLPCTLDLATAAGLQATAMPLAVVENLIPLLDPLPEWKPTAPPWLEALAAHYQLDAARFRERVEREMRLKRFDFRPMLLAHWTLLGNSEGMLLARKGGPPLLPPAPRPEGHQHPGPDTCRELDLDLLHSAPDGFVPLYGVFPRQGEGVNRYRWLQPEAGLIVPAIDVEWVELTITCPEPPLVSRPVWIEIRLEDEADPAAVFGIAPGQTLRLKVPGPLPDDFGSALLRLRASVGFRPSDFAPELHDTRLLALKLWDVRV
jgi:SAM-dependent methyltransferase